MIPTTSAEVMASGSRTLGRTMRSVHMHVHTLGKSKNMLKLHESYSTELNIQPTDMIFMSNESSKSMLSYGIGFACIQ